MRYEYVKIIIFWTLVSTVPGIIFLIQVVIMMPANLMFAAAILSLVKQNPGGLGVAIFYLAFFMINIALWALLSLAISKVICLIKQAAARNLLLSLVIAGLFVLPFLPIYGSGGHGASQWVTAAGLDDARLQYWLSVFPPTVFIALLNLWYRYRKIQSATQQVSKTSQS